MFQLATNETQWVLHQSFESFPDFCVWVLERDGLKIQPFDQHSDGNGELRAAGLTASLWQSWLKKTVLLLDRRLRWQVKDPQAEKQEKIASYERMTSNFATAYPALSVTPSRRNLEEEIDKYLLWREQQYQQANTVVRELYGSSEPLNIRSAQILEIWDGDAAVGERLQELWAHYRRVAYHQRNNRLVLTEESTDFSHTLWSALTPYHERLPALELYFVTYPAAIEYIVPPVSAILSVTDGLEDRNAFIKRVLSVAERLATLST